MDRVADEVINSYGAASFSTATAREEVRTKIARYLEAVSGGRRNDTDELKQYGLVYLRELYEGHDPRYSGC